LPKLHLSHNLLILGAPILLFAVNALADSNVSPALTVNQNLQLAQAGTAGTLGTIHNNDVNAPSTSSSNSGRTNTTPDSQITDNDALQPVQSGNVTYITGGIGDEERSALDAVKKDYNLRIVSAHTDGAFAGDTRIVIRDHNGDQLVDAAAGPLFYAKLPTGSYTVEATNQGRIKQQHVTVGHNKAASVHLSWQ